MSDAPDDVRIIPEKGFIAPGIYMRLPAEDHHAATNLGSSSHKKLKTHPAVFFDTWSGNPDRSDDKDTDALNFGSAVHAMVLKGKRELEKYFIEDPHGPDVLKLMDDMKRVLRPMGLAVSGNKEELIARVREHAPGLRIYDEIVDEAKRYGKKVLKPEAWARVMKASAHITMHPSLSRSFAGGKSEISVYWINRRGIRCKARFDYLRVIEAETASGKKGLMAVIADLKSFAAPRDIPMERAMEAACGPNLLQVMHYMDGFAAMLDMLRTEGLSAVKDLKPSDEEWLKLIAKTTMLRSYLVFYTSSGAPYANATEHRPKDRLLDFPRQQLLVNDQRFRQYYETFGTDMWVSLDDPRHLADEGAIKPWHL